ncbi:MAG: UDP-N-acetylmuramoyl-L-alanine--D-glutamate ligase, partial [Lachnospiraceae bacterium]|nr:UDP-N-acetylmuramoyl-L-alanine--D-glutamate ligase [Lachnospiraceae bacterium]
MDFQGKKVLIIGAGKSGIAAADLLTSKGADIILYDDKKLDEAEVLKKLSPDFKGSIISEKLPEEKIGNPDYLVLSPGVPIDSEKVLKYKDKGACVIGEVELAYYFTKGK